MKTKDKSFYLGAGLALLILLCSAAVTSIKYVGTFIGDGSGLTNVTGASGGAATNLTPWPSDINGNQHRLTNLLSLSTSGSNGLMALYDAAGSASITLAGSNGTVTATQFVGNLTGNASSATTATTSTYVSTSPLTNVVSAAKISGVIPIANLASGTPDGTKFVRDDGTLAVPSGGGGGSATNAITAIFTNAVSAQGSVTGLNINVGAGVSIVHTAAANRADLTLTVTPRGKVLFGAWTSASALASNTARWIYPVGGSVAVTEVTVMPFKPTLPGATGAWFSNMVFSYQVATGGGVSNIAAVFRAGPSATQMTNTSLTLTYAGTTAGTWTNDATASHAVWIADGAVCDVQLTAGAALPNPAGTIQLHYYDQ